MVKRASILGIDVGGVIIDAANDKHDTSMFGKNYLEATPVPGAFEAIALLRDRFLGELVIVSKAGPEMQKKTVHWLCHHRFWHAIGMSMRTEDDISKVYTDYNLFFCRERKDKAPICKRLNVTHFIDDKIEVLGHLQGVVKERYLFGAAHDVTVKRAGLFPTLAARCTALPDWRVALEKVWP